MKPHEPELIEFQQRATQDLLPILDGGNSALLIGPTGVGKTYISGFLLKQLINKILSSVGDDAFFPIFYITKSSVVQQTQEVLFREFGLPSDKVLVTNYDQLRSTIGTLWIKWRPSQVQRDLIDQGIKIKEKDWEEPEWHTIPQFIICDECQALKNPDALQTKVILAYLKAGGQVLLTSATPGAKVSELETVVLALKPNIPGYGVINHKTWPTYARDVSSPLGPNDLNSEAIKRVKAHIESKMVVLKGIRFKKQTRTHCKLIDFASKEDTEFFLKAYEDYIAELAKINRDAPGGIAAIWTATLKFRMRAEIIRFKEPYIPSIAMSATEKKQIIIGSNFVPSIERCHQSLLKLGLSEDRISVIIGGQDRKTREDNKRRFQTGKTDICLMTLKSGGVGLSLHHNPQNEKICRPRYVILPPTWSAIEIVQVLGRAHRINTISTTYQDIVWFRGTVEEEVANKLELKLHCLSELVGKRETWTGALSKRADIDSMEEFRKLNEEEFTTSDEFDSEEEFASEAFNNNSTNDEP